MFKFIMLFVILFNSYILHAKINTSSTELELQNNVEFYVEKPMEEWVIFKANTDFCYQKICFKSGTILYGWVYSFSEDNEQITFSLNVAPTIKLHYLEKKYSQYNYDKRVFKISKGVVFDFKAPN